MDETLRVPEGLNLGEIVDYADLVAQVITTAKSLKASGVGATHVMPTIKTKIGNQYWEADLGTWKRLK